MYGITNIVFIALAGLGVILAAIPLPKAIASGNLGTTMLITWAELAGLVSLVNAVRWNGNIENWTPIWCDFCSHFLLAVDVALVGCAVAVNRRLHMIVTLDARRHAKLLNAIVDIVLCLVIPLFSVGLGYVVQQYRYVIYEDIGCTPGVASVRLAFPLVWMIPLFMGIISAGYAVLNIKASFQRNLKVAEDSRASLAWSRRLTAIGVVSTLYVLVPTSLSIAFLETAFPATPWPGWDAVHATMGQVVYVPAQEWQSSAIMIASMELRRWTIVTVSYVIFLFLGLTADVRKMYRVRLRSLNQVLSTVHSSRTVLDMDENLVDHRGASPPTWFCKPHDDPKLPPESFELRDRSRVDLDLENGRQTRHSFVTCPSPTSSWGPTHEEEEGVHTVLGHPPQDSAC